MEHPYVFRPRSARLTAIAMVGIACFAAAAHVAAEGLHAAAPTLGLATLASAVGIYAYWLPCVRVGDSHVEVANVLRTVSVPFARVILVDTRWALELHLDTGRKVSAFAAPAPGTMAARNFSADDLKGLPSETFVDSTARVGDSPRVASGQAALVVRTALAAWRATGLDNGETVERHANIGAIAAIGAGIIATIAGFTL